MELFINKLEQKLKEALPGEQAQYMMAPFRRPKMQEQPDLSAYRKSAVMVLICYDADGNLFIPLIQRFAYDGYHSGQVSLPGGKCEETDESVRGTALRECMEEIGVPAEKIKVLSDLSTVHIPVSKFIVHPILGFSEVNENDFIINPREVNHIVHLKIDDLLDEKIVHRSGIMMETDKKIEAPYFLVEGLKVWGATAMILSELKTILKSTF